MLAKRSAKRRYLIYSDRFATCALVYEGDGEWYVEKAGAAGVSVRLTLREFEASSTGTRLAMQLAAAVSEAQQDL